MIAIEESLKQCKKSKNKQKARLLLLKRKRLGNTIQSYYNSRNELEKVLISLEESSDQVALVQSYKTANSILKTTMRQRGGQSAVETYEDLAEDLQEARDDTAELQDAVSRNIGRGDDEIEDELEDYFSDPKPAPGNPPPQEKIQNSTQLLESLPPFPTVPNDNIVLSDAAAIRILEAELAA
jgi:hypothetical protein